MSDIRLLDNRLVARMSLADREIIADSATVIELQKGANLARPGDSLTYCWLPLSGMIAAIAQDGDGLEAEVAVIGNEGIADIAPLLGSGSASHRLLVQISGAALQLELRHVPSLDGEQPVVLNDDARLRARIHHSDELVGAVVRLLSDFAPLGSLAAHGRRQGRRPIPKHNARRAVDQAGCSPRRHNARAAGAGGRQPYQHETRLHSDPGSSRTGPACRFGLWRT